MVVPSFLKNATDLSETLSFLGKTRLGTLLPQPLGTRVNGYDEFS
jgi:hypothetical protein